MHSFISYQGVCAFSKQVLQKMSICYSAICQHNFMDDVKPNLNNAITVNGCLTLSQKSWIGMDCQLFFVVHELGSKQEVVALHAVDSRSVELLAKGCCG